MDSQETFVQMEGTAVLDLARKVESPMQVLLLALVLCTGVSFAQSNPTAEPSEPIRKYGSPPAINSNGIAEESISSADFERFISIPTLRQPSETHTATAPPNSFPVPSPGLQLVKPFDSGPIAPEIPDLDQSYTPVPVPVESADLSAPTPIVPYWQDRCVHPVFAIDPRFSCKVDLEQLIWQSAQYSPRVRSILIAPQIQRTEIQVASGEFDPRRFVQSHEHNTSDPTGNTLITGGPPRLNEQFWENSFGIRDRNLIGGRAELSQMMNGKNNNSLFFKPNNQADTKLSLNYTQPLLRGGGRFYNTSSIRLAGIKTNSSIAEANRDLQKHAMDIINTYWELTLNRYLLVQAQNGESRLRQIKEQLLNRSGRDLLPTQVSRADAAIAFQQSQMVNARAKIKSNEADLRRLVNSPELETRVCQEIIPLTVPTNEFHDVTLEDELSSAILYRGDIVAIQRSIEIAVVQRQIAANELRPTLDLMAGSYLRGLQGNYDFGGAWINQFGTGQPSFDVGLNYLNPVQNRSAKANLLGRELAKQVLLNDYSDALLKAQADITSAIEASKGTYASSLLAVKSTLSLKEEVEGHQAKFTDFFGENPSVSNILSDLLDAEGRLIAAENTWAKSQTQHMQALSQIKFQAGTLMTITAE